MAIRNLTLTYIERGSQGAISRWLYLRRSSDIQEHSAAGTTLTDLGAPTFPVTFLDLRKSQRSQLYCP